MLMKTLSLGSYPRRCLGTRCFLSFSAWLPCGPDRGSSPVVSSFLGINVFSSYSSFLPLKTRRYIDEKGDSAAASTTSPQSRSHKIKRKEKCFYGIACIYVELDRSACVCFYVSLCVLYNIKQPQCLCGVHRELLMCCQIL